MSEFNLSLPSAVIQLLEGNVDASVVLDENRKILYYNRAYETMSRLRGRRLRNAVEQGLYCYEAMPLSICESECVGCKAQKLERTIRMDEIERKRLDEREESATYIVTAAWVDSKFIVETYRDVTAEARVQSRLKSLLKRERQMNATLEGKVKERTEELEFAHAQLVLQEKMSTLGRLVAGIAHELNNPINFIYGNVDFLDGYVENLLSLVDFLEKSDEISPALREALNEKKEEIEYDYLVADCSKLIDSIRTGAERTATIVRDLKNFSHAGSSTWKEFDVQHGIETTLNLIEPLIKGRIEVHREYAEALPRISCNGGHINQVFMNILTNAAQAIEGEGAIRITIDTIEHGEQLRIEIADTGPGISEENRAKITDPFFTTKEVGEGSGLGLWITLSIIRRHGGVLACRSELGEGATFTVILPVNPPELSGGQEGDFGYG